jgi:uncharacterized protein
MIRRPFWINKIEKAWEKRPIVWLSGVRRVGKTTLTKMFPEAVFQNCDLPSVTREMEDPELFFNRFDKGGTVIFDEVHRLKDPSRLLKIAADAYPHLRILATGSSTLEATKKFRDSLTGRKQMIYLPPVLWRECLDEFGIKDLDHRLLRGGLPEPLLSRSPEAQYYAEWMDSFYARDVQELFGIRNRAGFLDLLHLVIRHSGSLIDYSNLAKLSELSRPTVKAHIEAMAIAHALYLLPPFHGGGRREIVQRPKSYAFDTGLILFVKGWDIIREEDRGFLWEHLVLDDLRTRYDRQNIYFWRDKSGREVDFIIKGARNQVDAIECKVNPDKFNFKDLLVFRSLYPDGKNFVLSPKVLTPYQRQFGKLLVQFSSFIDEKRSADHYS